MAVSSKKKKKFKITPQVILRLFLFAAIMYLSINYFSSNKNILSKTDSTTLGSEIPSNVLGAMYQQLPPQSRNTIENFSSLPQVKFIQDKITQLKSQTSDFPQKQITEIQKNIVQSVLKNYLSNLENKK